MPTNESVTFETALGQLEAIAKKLEREDVTLEESVRLFEQGKQLAQTCERLLSEAKKKLEAAAAPPPADEDETLPF